MHREDEMRDEARLEQLRKELPDALTECALSLIPKERVDAIKQAIRDAQAFLEDYPLIDQGLEQRTAQAHRQLGRAVTQAERRERYEELKTQLREGHNVNPQWLRDYAHELREDADAEAFLSQLEAQG